MTNQPYLQRLTARLIDGVDRLPAEFRSRHAKWVAQQQRPDGGFAGRAGDSDLYYTGFALRSLAVLQALDPDICARAGAYVRGHSGSATHMSVVDCFSLLVSALLVQLGGEPELSFDAEWASSLAVRLAAHRHADGGYARSIGGTAGSTYTTFLAVLALELLGEIVPAPEQLVSFVRSRYRDGGFVEIAQMRRAGTNPTAAGVGTLQVFAALDETTSAGVAEFMQKMRSPGEGGLRANDRIPSADLLSTFTGSWTLADIGRSDLLNAAALRAYAEALQGPQGGFRGGAWDAGQDVEYTFYGIGLLGLLATL